MSKPAIIIEGLSKSYRIGHQFERYPTFREAIVRTLTGPLRRFRQLRAGGFGGSDREETFWALKDVSFEVQPGEVVGIIGRNGAGKSTLLKILSRITEPTEGRAILHGRVASLLEVGTGFHPELTGRENIYLNGAILGMKKAEIDRKFDEIVAFAEIEKFLDTPVKRYSSGMYVRLAFAVAAHLEPEILIVDEVLAVGDAEFQKKCLGKMQEVSRGQGRTVLFVSHNMGAVRTLCSEGVLLAEGKVVSAGQIDSVVSEYALGRSRRAGQTGSVVNEYAQGRSSIEDTIISHLLDCHDDLTVDSILVNGRYADRVGVVDRLGRLDIEVTGVVRRPIQMDVEVTFTDELGSKLGFFSPGHLRGSVPRFEVGPFRMALTIEAPWALARGLVFMSIDITHPCVRTWASIPWAVEFEVEGAPLPTGQVLERRQVGWLVLGA